MAVSARIYESRCRCSSCSDRKLGERSKSENAECALSGHLDPCAQSRAERDSAQRDAIGQLCKVSNGKEIGSPD